MDSKKPSLVVPVHHRWWFLPICLFLVVSLFLNQMSDAAATDMVGEPELADEARAALPDQPELAKDSEQTTLDQPEPTSEQQQKVPDNPEPVTEHGQLLPEHPKVIGEHGQIIPDHTEILGKQEQTPVDHRQPTSEMTTTVPEWFTTEDRGDVQTLTAWSAPILWEGTFNRDFLNKKHKKEKTVIGLAVFAPGRYFEQYLKSFLDSAEQYFMIGQTVIYYVMVDDVSKVPYFFLPRKRFMKVFKIKQEARWQDNSMMRMHFLGELIDSHIEHEADYIFCMEVNQRFTGPFGAEALGDLVGQIKAEFYKAPKEQFVYERNMDSAAFISFDEGDFYYHAAVFGGIPSKVFHLVRTCYEGIKKDRKKNIEATRYEESHLNRYLLDHKPTLLLSPEYCWENELDKNPDIKIVRLSWTVTQHDAVSGN